MYIIPIDIVLNKCYYIVTAREQTKTVETPAIVEA